jgi:hypothetical protein
MDFNRLWRRPARLLGTWHQLREQLPAEPMRDVTASYPRHTHHHIVALLEASNQMAASDEKQARLLCCRQEDGQLRQQAKTNPRVKKKKKVCGCWYPLTEALIQ